MADVIKLGFFGLKNRTTTLLAASHLKDKGVKVTACFDDGRFAAETEKFAELFPKAVVYHDAEAFMNSGINAVVLGDCAKGTADKAVKFMNRGIAVLAGAMPAKTLADAVKLVRTYEQTGVAYMTGDPIVFSAPVQKMKELYTSGKFGKLIFGEGEYLSDGSYTCENVPPVNYGTHALLPLLYVTGDTPDKLAARASFNHMDAAAHGAKGKETIPQTLLLMKSGAVIRICASTRVQARGSWYRVATTVGGIETVRGKETDLYYGYSEKMKPEDFDAEKNTKTETAEYPAVLQKKYKGIENDEIAEILMLGYFISVLRGEQENEFDAYKAAMLASVLLLGCRSGYNDGMPYLLPDFRVEGIRKLYERDEMTPIPNEFGFASMPITAKQS